MCVCVWQVPVAPIDNALRILESLTVVNSTPLFRGMFFRDEAMNEAKRRRFVGGFFRGLMGRRNWIESLSSTMSGLAATFWGGFSKVR